MRIVIMGAGGLGGYFGARLAAAGNDVAFVARGAHLAAMRANGLVLRSARGDLHLTGISATDDPSTLDPADLVLIGVKLWDTEAAATAARPLVRPGTAVVSFQNGIEKDEVLARILGRDAVIGGTALRGGKGSMLGTLIGIFFLVGGVVWLGERRLGLSGASTALGTCFKLFPVVVAPMAVAALGSRWSRARSGRATAPGTDAAGRDVARWVVPFGAVSAVVFVPFLILNASNTLWFIRFNDLRPQKDSLWELPARVLGSTLVGSGTINALSLVAVVAAVAYGARMVWLTPEPAQFRSVTLATALTMVVWMGVNKVWNPQYILWVFAASALAGMPARFGVALGALSVYDYGFEFILRRPDQHNPYLWVGYIMEVARTVLFVLMVVWVVARLRAGRHAPAEPVGGNPAAVAT